MFSDSITIQRGVPQGAALSPILYSIFINDTPAPSPERTKFELCRRHCVLDCNKNGHFCYQKNYINRQNLLSNGIKYGNSNLMKQKLNLLFFILVEEEQRKTKINKFQSIM